MDEITQFVLPLRSDTAVMLIGIMCAFCSLVFASAEYRDRVLGVNGVALAAVYVTMRTYGLVGI